MDNPSEIITKETAFGLSGSSFFYLCVIIQKCGKNNEWFEGYTRKVENRTTQSDAGSVC
ncbi:putative ATP-independent RNA helicase domain protein [Bacteroides fragilis str. 3397 N2]|nr:putative ATP-independent RNA helicase domain protein [Bacteroides fragilis str. 3397 N2]EXZ54173.1 putative ATP-independent RNA helicase domain protein [Bacteroides fragilis str. 3397 T14]EYA43489.1 putative ATP-independent RNA helicase domain protein [Bacteroides fragilis str. 3397 N3]